MMKMFKEQLHLFFTNKLLLILYSLMCIIPSLFVLYFATEGADAIFLFNILVRFLVFINIIFMICCYIFLTMDSQNKEREVLRCLNKPYIYRNLSVFVLLMLLVIFNIFILSMLIISGLYVHNLSFMIELIQRYYLMNILLPQICTFSIVILISQISKQILILPLFVIVIFLISPYLDSFVWVEKPNFPIDTIISVIRQPFSVFLQNGENSMDTLYGLQNEIYKIYICLFWVVSALISLFAYRFNKKVIIGTYVVPCLLIIGIYMPQSKYRLDDSWNRGRADINTYQIMDMKNIYKSNKSVDYQIKNYQLKIDIQRELNVSGKIKLTSNTKQKDFVLTLYHDYKIKNLQCSISMDYKQDGDYIRISFDQPINEVDIDIEYSGYHPLLYSNHQAVQLPGYFAWYPMAGEKQLYVSIDSEIYWSYGYNPYNRVDSADFDITIHAPYPIVTNLNQVDDNKYHGISDSFTLIGGFLEKVDNQQYVNFFPLYTNSKSLDDEFVQSYKQNKEKIDNEMQLLFGNRMMLPKDKKVIICSNGLNQNTTLGAYSEFDDYIIIGHNGFLSISEYLSYYIYNQNNADKILKDIVLLSIDDGITKEEFVKRMQEEILICIESYKNVQDDEMIERHKRFKEFKKEMDDDIEKQGVDGYINKIAEELMG